MRKPCVECREQLTRAPSGVCRWCQMKGREPVRPGRRRRWCVECGKLTQAASGVCQECQDRIGIREHAALRGGRWVMQRGGVWVYRRDEAS